MIKINSTVSLLSQEYRNAVIISTSLVILCALTCIGIVDVNATPTNFTNVTIAHPGVVFPWEHLTTLATNTTDLTGAVVVTVIDQDDHGNTPINGFPNEITVKNARAVPASFKGSPLGTVVKMTPGEYTIQAKGYSGLIINPIGDCSGTINSGQIKACAIIYRGTLLR